MSRFCWSAFLAPIAFCLLSGTAADAADSGIEAKIGAKKLLVEKTVGDISATRIEAYIRRLVGFRTRHTMSDTQSETTGIGAARRWIKSELERCGADKLNVSFDSYVEG